MQNLNVDTDDDDDWTPDEFLDETGSGEATVEPGTLVTLSATVSAGGNAEAAPEVTILEDAGDEFKAEVKYDAATGKLTAEYRVMASDTSAGTYKIRISKPGCTYFELTGVPMITSVTSIDLDSSNIELLAGDTNGDGNIDAFDLDAINSNYYQSVTPYTNGDVNGDGNVDAFDLDAINMNYYKQSILNAYDSLK